MSKEIRTGMNRTGLQASPMDSKDLLECLDLQPEPTYPDVDVAELRALYRSQADAVGSMPPPASFRGLVGSVGKALTGQRMHVFLDKLGERAAYERTGTRIYDAALTRLADADLPEGMTLAHLQEIRDEERKHFLLLSDAIRELGGDPTTQTPCADFAGVQGMGLVQAINDPRATLPQVLETLLAAELIDVASWEMLIEMANVMGQEQLGIRFADALATENEHLEKVRAWLSRAMELSGSITGTE